MTDRTKEPMGVICDLGNTNGCQKYPGCGCYERFKQRKMNEHLSSNERCKHLVVFSSASEGYRRTWCPTCGKSLPHEALEATWRGAHETPARRLGPPDIICPKCGEYIMNPVDDAQPSCATTGDSATGSLQAAETSSSNQADASGTEEMPPAVLAAPTARGSLPNSLADLPEAVGRIVRIGYCSKHGEFAGYDRCPCAHPERPQLRAVETSGEG